MSKQTGNVIRLGAGTKYSCDKCDRTSKAQLCSKHFDEIEDDFFNRGRQYERHLIEEANKPKEIEV